MFVLLGKKSGGRGGCGSVSIFVPKSNKSSRMPIAVTIRRLLDPVTYLACRIGFKSFSRHRETALECRDVRLTRKKILEDVVGVEV